MAHIEIDIYPLLQKEKEAAYHECMEVLSEKYGKPTPLLRKNKIPEETFLWVAKLKQTYLWTAGDQATIRLDKIMSSLKITYMHNHWSNRMLVERKRLSDQKTGRNNMARETGKF